MVSLRFVIAGCLTVAAVVLVLLNALWRFQRKRAEAAARRGPSVVPVGAPILATIGALVGNDGWFFAAALAITLTDPGTWILLVLLTPTAADRAIAAIGLGLVSVGAFGVGATIVFFGGVAAALLGALLIVAAAWRGRARLNTNQPLLGFIVVAAIGVVSSRLGGVWLYSRVRAEIPQLMRIAAHPARYPDIVDISGSSLFGHAFVSELSIRSYSVRFPLSDGSVIEYVSDPRDRRWQTRCSTEIQPGWYRRFRCSQ